MTPDPKWIDALKLPPKATVAVALASSVLFTLNLRGVLDLGVLGTGAIVVAVVFWVLSIVNLADYLFIPIREKRRQQTLSTRRAVRRKEQEEQREADRATVLERLEHLSAEELPYIVECLKNGSPTFYTYAHSSPVSMLLGKGLVWTPGGTHHQDHYPFSFYDFVWSEILKRNDEFRSRHEECAAAEAAEREAQRRRRGY